MRFEDYETIRFERRGPAIYCTLNTPDRLNAFAGRSHTEISNLFYDLACDEESQIIVLTGAGRAFSAGGDIDLMAKNREDMRLTHQGLREAKRVVFNLLDCDKPVIAKVNGDAIGLGATVALLCDIVFAAETARFADPHNNVGLIAGDGGCVIWPQLIGYGRAKHYLFTGAKIGAKEAAEIGLIHRAVPADQLDAEVDAYVETLKALPLQSLRWTKATVNIGLKQLAHSIMDAGVAYEGVATVTADHGEAIEAFRAKRKPEFNRG